MKRVQRTLTNKPRFRTCLSSLGKYATVDVTSEVIAHVRNVARCGSVWACPLCAPVIRQKRAEHIETGLAGWLEQGHGAVFVTLTLSHHQADDLAGRLGVVAQSLARCLDGRPWQKRAARLGYVGAIKAVEVTWGEANGWHPHSHSVLLFERPPTAVQVRDLRSWLFGRWSKVVAAQGFGTISARHGVDVRTVSGANSGEQLGRYLTKVEDGWGVGLELARADLKAGRRGGYNAADLLRQLIATGESKWAALWREYEAATFGKRAVMWSPGLRVRLLGVEQDPEDEDLAASEGVGLTLLRAWVPAVQWNALMRLGRQSDLLDEIEDAASVFLLLARVSGHEPPVLDMPRGGERDAEGNVKVTSPSQGRRRSRQEGASAVRATGLPAGDAGRRVAVR